MSKNGTQQSRGSHGRDESHMMAADATDRATAFLEKTGSIRGVSGNVLYHSMATTRKQEIGAGVANAWPRAGSISRIPCPYDLVRGTLQDPLADPLTLVASSETPPQLSTAGIARHGLHGDGGRFHSAGGLPH